MQQADKYVIYALVDPRDNSVRYVGMTQDIYKRFIDHIQCSGSNFAKHTWIVELRSLNKMVIMRELEEIKGREQAEEREWYWIRHFQMMHEPLMNINKIRKMAPSPRTRKMTTYTGKPRLDEVQEELFATAYEITGNKDESLKRAGANSRFRQHATEIIERRGLRKKEG